MAKQTKKKIRVAINGFGRIGRAAFKIGLANDNVEVVALNDLTDAKTLAHLLQYDSIYGTYEHKVSGSGKQIKVLGKLFHVYAIPDPTKLPWKKHNVDVVLECTGRFVKDGAAKAHLKAGARKVIVSAPAKGRGNVGTFLFGVNEKDYSGEDVVSNASCTTNCIAPVAEVIYAKLGIEKAMMTTIHSYTADQNLQDGSHSDLRRARAAAMNIIPTTTGAAVATTQTIPELKGLFDGVALRVPSITGSISDLTLLLSRPIPFITFLNNRKNLRPSLILKAIRQILNGAGYCLLLEVKHFSVVQIRQVLADVLN